MKTITSIFVDPVKWKKLHIRAIEEDTSRSAILDNLIEEYLEKAI